MGTRALKGTVTRILLGGLVAGTIDLGAACVINLLGPVVIMQAIAAGFLGNASFSGGAATAALGLVSQWVMSIIIAAIFVFAAHLLPALKRRWILAGLAYGVVIFYVMNYVVVPLSAVGHPFKFGVIAYIENMVAMLVFGVIITSFARERASS